MATKSQNTAFIVPKVNGQRAGEVLSTACLKALLEKLPPSNDIMTKDGGRTIAMAKQLFMQMRNNEAITYLAAELGGEKEAFLATVEIRGPARAFAAYALAFKSKERPFELLVEIIGIIEACEFASLLFGPMEAKRRFGRLTNMIFKENKDQTWKKRYETARRLAMRDLEMGNGKRPAKKTVEELLLTETPATTLKVLTKRHKTAGAAFQEIETVAGSEAAFKTVALAGSQKKAFQILLGIRKPAEAVKFVCEVYGSQELGEGMRVAAQVLKPGFVIDVAVKKYGFERIFERVTYNTEHWLGFVFPRYLKAHPERREELENANVGNRLKKIFGRDWRARLGVPDS